MAGSIWSDWGFWGAGRTILGQSLRFSTKGRTGKLLNMWFPVKRKTKEFTTAGYGWCLAFVVLLGVALLADDAGAWIIVPEDFVFPEQPPDQDGDSVSDFLANCIFIANGSQSDIDNDGVGDDCDPDRDGDATSSVR